MKNVVTLNTTAPWKDYLIAKLTEMEAYRQQRDTWVGNFSEIVGEVENLAQTMVSSSQGGESLRVTSATLEPDQVEQYFKGFPLRLKAIKE